MEKTNSNIINFQGANRRYPAQYIRTATLNDGIQLTIRPIRPDDQPLMVKFHETLSVQSVYMRWFTALGLTQRIDPERLKRVCNIDYKNEMVVVAEYLNAETGEHSIVGAGRLNRVPGTNDGEISLIISDAYQRRGLGKEVMNSLVEIGCQSSYDRIVGDVHPENYSMKTLCKKLGFQVRYSYEDEVTKIALPLAS